MPWEGALHAVLLLAGLVLLLPACPLRSGRARIGLLAVVQIYSVRYWLWRATATLPEWELSPSSVWQWGFFGIESMSLLFLCVSGIVLMARTDRSRLADEREAKLKNEPNPPSVAVFIPTANEPRDVLEPAIRAASAIDYPNVGVFVLDDDKGPPPGEKSLPVHWWLPALCGQYGVQYCQRKTSAGAKAGNLNYGLTQSQSDVVLVLDADFVAEPGILWRTVGLLDDTVALVQTPQHFSNPDAIQGNLRISKWATEEQRFFFDEVLPALDWWGNAACVGTSFVVRRDALGPEGFPTGALSEDVYLGYRLMANGYQVRYLNERLSAGAAASSAAEYVKQRVRWSMGSVQFPFLEFGPLRASRLRLLDRVLFANMSLYWIVEFSFLAAILFSPVVYFWSGVPVFLASLDEAGAFILPRIIASAMVMFWRSEGRVMPVVSDIRKLVGLPQLLAGIVSVLVSPYGKPFKVTTKEPSNEVVVHWHLLWPYVGLGAATAAGLGVALFSGLSPIGWDEYLPVNLALGLYSLLLCALACFACIDVPQQALAPDGPPPLRGRFWRAMRGLLVPGGSGRALPSLGR